MLTIVSLQVHKLKLKSVYRFIFPEFLHPTVSCFHFTSSCFSDLVSGMHVEQQGRGGQVIFDARSTPQRHRTLGLLLATATNFPLYNIDFPLCCMEVIDATGESSLLAKDFPSWFLFEYIQPYFTCKFQSTHTGLGRNNE